MNNMNMWNAKGFAERNNIPYQIDLKTRRGLVETRLTIVGFCADEVNYSINAEYPYSLHGEPGNYVAIDFSEGPMLSPGYIIQEGDQQALILKSIEESATTDGQPLIVFNKIDKSLFKR